MIGIFLPSCSFQKLFSLDLLFFVYCLRSRYVKRSPPLLSHHLGCISSTVAQPLRQTSCPQKQVAPVFSEPGQLNTINFEGKQSEPTPLKVALNKAVISLQEYWTIPKYAFSEPKSVSNITPLFFSLSFFLCVCNLQRRATNLSTWSVFVNFLLRTYCHWRLKYGIFPRLAF